MSRIAKMGVAVPSGVDVQVKDDQITVKGSGGELKLAPSHLVKITTKDGKLSFDPVDESREANAMSGTMRQLVNNMVVGVSIRAQASGNKLNLQIGYSHPVNFEMPAGVTVTTPTPTEIIVKGANRQVIGQLAAEIRDARPPEPYKGKGIRYADERVVIKETKKK